MIENEINKIRVGLQEDKDLELVKFDVNLLENQYGKYTSLLNNISNDFSYEFINKSYRFNFKKPVFVDNIRFIALDGIDLKGLEVTFIDYHKNEKTPSSFSKGNNSLIANEILYGFTLYVPKRLRDKIKLSRIEILGFELEYLNEVSNKYSNLEEIKTNLNFLLNNLIKKDNEIDEKIKIYENAVNELKEQIDSKRNILEELNTNINDLENNILTNLNDQKDKLEKENQNIKTRNEDLLIKNTSLENNIKQLNQTSNNLNIKISEQKSELQKLTEDTNLFATELTEYIKQGNEDIRLYTYLSVIPWILISIVTAIIFFGSSELTMIYSLVKDGTLDKVDLNTIFWSRIPFVIIVISILFVCYEISKIFIKNIIHIQKQKRIFMKIGIVAKDVADQSILGLDVSETEKFELRTKLKMDLLKSHLSNEIGENYEYKVNFSLWDHFKGYMERQLTKNFIKEENDK